MITTCQDDGQWYPDPNEVVCQIDKLLRWDLDTTDHHQELDFHTVIVEFHCNGFCDFRGVHTPCEFNQLGAKL